ncbi:hypothetical protein D3C80_1327030 [compost metagenome]
MRAYAFKYAGERDGTSIRGFTGFHRSSAHKHSRNVNAKRAHDHARCNFVAVRNTYHSVKPVSINNCLNGVCNDLTARKRVAHTDMSHRNTVIDTDCIKFERYAACFANRFFNKLSEFLQVDVARDNVNIRVANRDKRLVEILFLNACGTQQATVRCAVEAFFDHI